MAGPIQALICIRGTPQAWLNALALASKTPACKPRQPAWAAATPSALPELLKATKTTGKQSAVMIAKARLQLTLTEASATGGVVPDDIASLASLASNTSQPC